MTSSKIQSISHPQTNQSKYHPTSHTTTVTKICHHISPPSSSYVRDVNTSKISTHPSSSLIPHKTYIHRVHIRSCRNQHPHHLHMTSTCRNVKGCLWI